MNSALSALLSGLRLSSARASALVSTRASMRVFITAACVSGSIRSSASVFIFT